MNKQQIAFIENKLCIPAAWLYTEQAAENGREAVQFPALLTKTNYEKRVTRKQIHTLGHPGPNKPAMVVFDRLDERMQSELTARLGESPYKLAKRNLIERSITPDALSADFFNRYVKPDGSYIAPERQREYMVTAWIFNSITHILNNRRSMQFKVIGKTKGAIWNYFNEEVQALSKEDFPHKLPSSPKRLKDKYDRYMAEGFESLVHKNVGNQSALKTTLEEQEAVLAKLIMHHNNLDNEQIASLYNVFAKPMGWKTITRGTVANRKEKNEVLATVGKHGLTEFRNTQSMQVKRSAPSAALYYWTLDGWDAELLYQKTEIDSKGHSFTSYHNRPTVVIVLDAVCKYPVGYAIGTHETPHLIREALHNAILHTKELFGDYHKPYQLQSDHYGKGVLTPLYTACSVHYTPARVKNAKAKIIEPYFKYINKQFAQLQPNWSGFGITSTKKNQPNTEAVNMKKHSFPDYEGVRYQLSMIIEAERKIKIEAYRKAFTKMDINKQSKLTEMQLFDLFGESTGFTNRLTPSGLYCKILGEDKCFDSFDMDFRMKAFNVDWTIKYIQGEPSKVLAVNPEGTLKFMLQEKFIQPMALADRKQGDALQLQEVRNYNQLLEQKVFDYTKHNNEVIENVLNDERIENTLTKILITDSRGRHKDNKSQARLQKSVVELEKNNQKQQQKQVKVIEKTFKNEREDYLNEKVDISQYLD